MKYVLDELQLSLKYHTRQLEQNKHEIQMKTESIESLKKSNIKHEQSIEQIEKVIEMLEKGE